MFGAAKSTEPGGETNQKMECKIALQKMECNIALQKMECKILVLIIKRAGKVQNQVGKPTKKRWSAKLHSGKWSAKLQSEKWSAKSRLDQNKTKNNRFRR